MEKVLLEFIEWGKVHWWFFGWTAFFGVLLLIHLIGAIIKLVFFKFPNRLMRALTILIRGWPPVGLDADGDLNKRINMTMNDVTLKEFKKNIIDELAIRKV